jgi:hypothetical protein
VDDNAQSLELPTEGFPRSGCQHSIVLSGRLTAFSGQKAPRLKPTALYAGFKSLQASEVGCFGSTRRAQKPEKTLHRITFHKRTMLNWDRSETGNTKPERQFNARSNRSASRTIPRKFPVFRNLASRFLKTNGLRQNPPPNAMKIGNLLQTHRGGYPLSSARKRLHEQRMSSRHALVHAINPQLFP